MCASFKGHAGAVELLLAHEGIDVNQTNTSGKTALMWASIEGHADAVERLLAHEGLDEIGRAHV